MPPFLCAELRAELTARERIEEACDPNSPDSEVVGGEQADVALQHFARRFVLSSARVQFVTLGQGKHFEPISTDLRSFLHDGRVTVLDLACGSGGGLLGLLCTIAELRRREAHARLPVELHVLAADISPTAREIHECMLKRVSKTLADVGIRMTYTHMDWDAADGYSTARLMDAWFAQAGNSEAFLVFVSAFGAFTQKNMPVVRTALRDILVRFHDDKQLLVSWIEPSMGGMGKWYTPLLEMFIGLFTGRGSATGHDTEVKFDWRHPFTDAPITGSAKLIACDRGSHE